MDSEDLFNDNPLNSTVVESSENDEPHFADNSPITDNSKQIHDEDIFVTVTDPTKQVLTMETFVSYKVTTNTTRSSYDSSQFVVQRRYQDFVWLREKLEEEYPTYILPPLPSKFVVKGMLDRFSSEFTETRCRALNKFLQRIASHPVVSFCDHLKIFLTNEKNFSGSGKLGILSRMSGSFKWSNVKNPEFESINDTVAVFGEKLGAMDRVNERLLLEKKDMFNELNEFAPTFDEWGKSENDPIESLMNSVSECLQLCTDELKTNIKISEEETVPMVKEYILYAENIKQVLKRRDNIQYQFEKVDEELKAKKSEKENLGKSDQSLSLGSLMGKTPEQREEKLSQTIQDLSSQREKANDLMTRANADFQVDYERWKIQKFKDTANTLSKMASCQVSYHKNCLSAWEKILPTAKTSNS